jgi:hypothetical protein
VACGLTDLVGAFGERPEAVVCGDHLAVGGGVLGYADEQTGRVTSAEQALGRFGESHELADDARASSARRSKIPDACFINSAAAACLAGEALAAMSQPPTQSGMTVVQLT